MTDNNAATKNQFGITPALIDTIGDAFNANDIDAVMPFFAEDAIFDHGAGPEIYGTRFEGTQQIRQVFSGLFEKVDSVHWVTLDVRIADDKAYCEYHRTAKLKTGETQDFLSVDILTFRDGLIIHKDTYYKDRTV
ncbi:hypothetical protein AB833_04005 [Chromatiales bacterium (ex Bugula neritina AB1)]|nr:hypothetical protein AB833_04005 [Chromatiales bacterium (ex Bugula neritina AB1)]